MVLYAGLLTGPGSLAWHPGLPGAVENRVPLDVKWPWLQPGDSEDRSCLQLSLCFCRHYSRGSCLLCLCPTPAQGMEMDFSKFGGLQTIQTKGGP